MRVLTLFLITGLVLALAVPAGAITFNQAWVGPTQWTLVDMDSGTLWNVPVSTGPVSVGVPGTPAFPLTPAPGARVDLTHASGFEDSWGVFQVVSIYKGAILLSGEIIRAGGTDNLLWQEGVTDGRELVGTYWGLEDLGVTTDASGVQTIESKSLTLLLYDQKANTFYNDTRYGGALSGAHGSLDRIGTGYKGVGPVNSSDGTAVQWMQATSSPGFLGTGAFATEFVGVFNPNAKAGTLSGSANFYVDVDPTVGQGGALYATGDYFKGVGGETADLRFLITVTANNPKNTPAKAGPPVVGGYDWTVTTTDDVDGAMVPEPVTMAGLLLGIGCLGRYVRKRR